MSGWSFSTSRADSNTHSQPVPTSAKPLPVVVSTFPVCVWVLVWPQVGVKAALGAHHQHFARALHLHCKHHSFQVKYLLLSAAPDMEAARFLGQLPFVSKAINVVGPSGTAPPPAALVVLGCSPWASLEGLSELERQGLTLVHRPTQCAKYTVPGARPRVCSAGH